jgi:ABC-type branched-subunit amino acid transport system ATPase component
MTALLTVQGLGKRFGGVRAVDGVDLTLESGLIHGVIGPNGSGKTTLLGLLSGTYRPSAGAILLEGRRIDGIAAHRTVDAGIARTFQTTRLFARWTLRDNLAIAATAKRARGEAAAAIGAALDLTGLGARADALGGSLSNAEQRLAMIAVALATKPRLVLLDEPAVGMSPAEAGHLGRVIRRIRDHDGMTIVIVEHNMHLMMGLADRIFVMNAGRRLAEGTPADIRADPAVIAAYLGH